MGLRKALEPSLNEAKGWEAIEKKINILRKKVSKIDNEVWMIQKAIRKTGGEPEDWTLESSYATGELEGICNKAQKIVNMFK